jgi:predicted nucleic acid-binding Zn ribbon protein
MTLRDFGPGYSMTRPKRPPRDCAICGKPIENPGWQQKVHAGKCSREWRIANVNKNREKAKLAKARKVERRRVGAIGGRKPLRSPKYLAWIRTLRCCVSESVR